MKTILLSVVVLLAGLWVTGCVTVDTPDRIQIGSGPPPQNVDSSHIPPTATHEEARAELHKAYEHIRYLESENARLRESRDKYKTKYKDLKDKYDD